MPSTEDIFWKEIKKNNVDDKLLDLPIVIQAEKGLENFVENIGEKFKKPKKPPIPKYPIKNLTETAFINKDKETTIQNVTNIEEKVPSQKINLKKHISLRVRSFDIFTRFKKDNKTISLITGEKNGLEYCQRNGRVINSIKGTYNISNNKAELNYQHSNGINNYRISCFSQNENVGVTTGYSNNKGFNSAFSIDKNSSALSVGYSKQYSEYRTLDVSAFATTGEKHSKPYAGLSLRATF